MPVLWQSRQVPLGERTYSSWVRAGAPQRPAECELPIRGARFEALIAPAVPSPVFAIRLRAVRVFSLADYVAAGIMTPRQRAVIEDAGAARKNILIFGDTGTGKMTLANAILAEIATTMGVAVKPLIVTTNGLAVAVTSGRICADPANLAAVVTDGVEVSVA